MTAVYQVRDRQFRKVTKRRWETRRLTGTGWTKWGNSSFIVTELNENEIRTYFGKAIKVNNGTDMG